MNEPSPISSGALLLRPLGAFVYQVLNAEGEVIYVGLSIDLCARFANHRRATPWWPEAHAFLYDEYETRADAGRAERSLIFRLKPRHNLKGINVDGGKRKSRARPPEAEAC